jgi:uncharacterized phiE125 gp8 family phage protein
MVTGCNPTPDYVYGLVRPFPVESILEDTATEEHLRIAAGQEAVLVDRLMQASTLWIEQMTQYVGITATLIQTATAFPFQTDPIELSRSPLQSVTSVTYGNVDDGTYPANMTTVDPTGYRLSKGKVVPTITPLDAWPTLAPGDTVEITFVAGFGPARSDVPAPFKQAALLLVGNWYENREQEITGVVPHDLMFGVQSLLAAYTREDVL